MKIAILVTALIAAACSTASPATTQPTPQSTVVSDPISAFSSAPGPAVTPPPQVPSPSANEPFVVSTCRAPATPTTASTEGPYFRAGSPEKASLVTPGMQGTRILLVGLVQTRSCKPVANAKVDIWQANANGEYDNTGYALRGHVRTNADGQYKIETIVPGRYPGRTPHIHVKVGPPAGGVLTTQLYMPNEPGNAGDGIFRPDLTMKVEQGPPPFGMFVFIVDLP